MRDIEIFEVGYCKHPEFMVIQGGGLKSIEFPAVAALIRHPQGSLLFDTGYAAHFFVATRAFPERLYAMATPATLGQPLLERLPEHIQSIFVSHFHADHIAGLRDLPNVPIFCSREGYEFVVSDKISRFGKVRKGVLPALLPEDFMQRAIFIEDLPKVPLPDKLQPFTEGYLVLDELYAIKLPGHARGHYGLFYKDCFLVADAIWNRKTIIENRRPNFLTALVMDDIKAYYQTIDRLQALHQRSPHIHILPTHCTQSLNEFKGNYAEKA